MKGTTWVRERQKRKPLLGFENDSPKYIAGQEVEVTADQVRKFTNRGVAVEITPARAPARAEVRAEPKPEPKQEVKSEDKSAK